MQTEVVFSQNLTHEWNHGLGEIVTALLEQGMRLTMFEEHDSVPWEAFPGQMKDIGGGEWRLADRPERLPHTYTLQARKLCRQVTSTVAGSTERETVAGGRDLTFSILSQP